MKNLHWIKIAVLSLLSVSFLPFAVGQNNNFKRETYVGLSGGATGSMVYFKPIVEQNYLLAYQGGFVFRYISEKHLGVQAEINYVQRGWSETNGAFDKRLDYIELPFLTHIYFGRNARVFLNLGPQIGYLLKETVLQNSHPDSTNEQHIHAIQNKLEYGLTAGLGCSFHIKRQVLQLEARGNFSASDIYSNERRDYFDNSNLITASVSLSWLIQVNK